MDEDLHEHPFYGQTIVRQNQQDYVKSLMLKYQAEPISE